MRWLNSKWGLERGLRIIFWCFLNVRSIEDVKRYVKVIEGRIYIFLGVFGLEGGIVIETV